MYVCVCVCTWTCNVPQSQIKVWITLSIPKVEDGNNFGVSVQVCVCVCVCVWVGGCGCLCGWVWVFREKYNIRNIWTCPDTDYFDGYFRKLYLNLTKLVAETCLCEILGSTKGTDIVCTILCTTIYSLKIRHI